MSNESFEGLVGALRAVGPASSPAKIASLIAPTMNELSEETITDIIGALLSLYNVKSVNELDSEELIDDVGKAISLAKLPASPDVELLKQRFTVLLDIPSLVISAKAFAIQREQPRVFAAARTFSDIRPVFSDDGERPLGALVQHQLRSLTSRALRPKSFSCCWMMRISQSSRRSSRAHKPSRRH
jgi:hypothetical protein